MEDGRRGGLAGGTINSDPATEDEHEAMTDASDIGPLDVGSLLASVGLEQLADVFRAHDIDGEVLPGLVEADLRELGLPSASARNG